MGAARRAARPGRVPAALVLDPPWSLRIQDEAPLDARRGGPRRGLDRPDDGERSRACDRGDVADRPRARAVHGRRRPGTAPQVDHPPGPALHHARRPRARARRWPRRPHAGATAATARPCCSPAPTSCDGEVSRRLLARAAAAARAARGDWDCPLVAAAGRGDRQGRAGPGGRARPAAGPAADRRRCAPGSPARGRRAGAGTGRTATRSSARRCGCCTTTRRTRGRWPSWPPRPGCPGRRWPAASPSWSASRR